MQESILTPFQTEQEKIGPLFNKEIENLKAKMKEHDEKLINEIGLHSKTLSEDEAIVLRNLRIPKAIDFSPYVTFIRNQDGWGGCGAMATLGVLEILKELEHPFSPTLSYRFLEYVYDVSEGNTPGDPNVQVVKGLNQSAVLEAYGCCTEASLQSNFDLNPLPIPIERHYLEAKMYRQRSHSAWIAVSSADQIKALIFQHGPILASGGLPGGSGFNDHIFAIIGYNDNLGSFKVLNSWGDQWGDKGMMDVPYDIFTDPLKHHMVPHIGSVLWIENRPTPHFLQHPFTARFKINHTIGRNRLTVKIGVEGQPPVMVWDKPNQANCPDNSKNLFITVPLPAYATRFWPPNERNQWYFEVTDSSSGPASETAAFIEEVTFAQRVLTPGDQCIPHLFRPSANHFPVANGGTTKIYIPSKKRYILNLTTNAVEVKRGSSVVLQGHLYLKLQLSNTRNPQIPLANLPVNIYKTVTDPIEQTIMESLIATVQTDEHGAYAFSYQPQETSGYQAIVKKTDGTILAVSNLIEVKV